MLKLKYFYLFIYSYVTDHEGAFQNQFILGVLIF